MASLRSRHSAVRRVVYPAADSKNDDEQSHSTARSAPPQLPEGGPSLAAPRAFFTPLDLEVLQSLDQLRLRPPPSAPSYLSAPPAAYYFEVMLGDEDVAGMDGPILERIESESGAQLRIVVERARPGRSPLSIRANTLAQMEIAKGMLGQQLNAVATAAKATSFELADSNGPKWRAGAQPSSLQQGWSSMLDAEPVYLDSCKFVTTSSGSSSSSQSSCLPNGVNEQTIPWLEKANHQCKDTRHTSEFTELKAEIANLRAELSALKSRQTTSGDDGGEKTFKSKFPKCASCSV